GSSLSSNLLSTYRLMESPTNRSSRDFLATLQYQETVYGMQWVRYTPTSSSITNFFYSLMLHPHVQRRIQKELDECIGVGGSPTMAEIQTFHYFKAAWNESMRLNVTSPLGIAHLTTEEDIYKGYYIPKGSNLWGEDADVYNPERFLPECNPRAKQLPDIVCPGRHLSERTALLFTAAVLSSFEIVPMEGESGEPTDFVDSVVRSVFSSNDYPSSHKVVFLDGRSTLGARNMALSQAERPFGKASTSEPDFVARRQSQF
ncbi:14187_t:CDS:2, partial [Acaulospora colombiana]